MERDRLTEKYLRSRKIPSTACSGCGLGQSHKALVQALDELDYQVDDIIWGTSIGCAGRQTFATWKGDNFAGTHGRVYAIARGLRLALPPEKKIVLTVGDGDAFGIGLNHLLYTLDRIHALEPVRVPPELLEPGRAALERMLAIEGSPPAGGAP